MTYNHPTYGLLPLAEYTGPVVNVDPVPVAHRGAWRMYCPHCATAPIAFDGSVVQVEAPPVVDLYDVLWSDTIIWVSIWTGKCPRCGTVYQTWRTV